MRLIFKICARNLIRVVAIGFIVQLFSVGAATPAIVITNLPAFGAYGNLSGFVTNANFATNSVAAFIFLGGGWYSKPYCSPQLTSLQTNGVWSANVTTSPSDTNATEFAAFLVPTNYNLPCVNGDSSLLIPTQAEATVYAVRVDTTMRQFNFAGYGWWVRNNISLQGPGPNYFSDSTNNVWVDALGALHLKITHTNSQWRCAEVISDRSFGYGQYRFTVGTPVNVLGTNAVLGMFTWSDDAAYNDREIDIEQSRWEYAYGPNDVEDYAISPYNTGQQTNFALPSYVTNSTHSFIWQSNNVAFQSLSGNFASPPVSSNVLATWNCGLGIPLAGGEQVHINLWLENGTPPSSNQPVEMVLSNFEFVPLGSPAPAQWQSWTFTNGSFRANMKSVSDWHYVIQSSSDLMNWTNLTSVIATNPVSQIADTNGPASGRNFYRAVTQP